MVAGLDAPEAEIVAVFVFPDIHAYGANRPGARRPLQGSTCVVGRQSVVARVHEGLAHKLCVLVVGIGIPVQVIRGVENPGAGPERAAVSEEEGVSVPRGE